MAGYALTISFTTTPRRQAFTTYDGKTYEKAA